MNLNEILSMLETSMTTGIEKTASDNKDKDVPAGSEQFTKTASAIQEAEELGAKVAAQLLKQAEDEAKSEDEDKKKAKEEGETKEETKAEAKKEGETEAEEKEENSNKEENMDKKANLIDVITGMLEKSASEGDDNPATGVAEGAVPNKAQVDSAAMVADFNNIQAPTPGTDGTATGGTVNQILDAIVAKAQGQGTINPVQGQSEGSQVGAERSDEDVEKTAAVVALVESGIDFDSAVNLVKQAEVEIQAEAWEQEKQAAFSALVEAGVDFDTATSMVKQACEDLEKQAFSAAGIGAKVDSGAAWLANKARGAYAAAKAPVVAAGKSVAEHGRLTARDAGNVKPLVAGMVDAATMKGVPMGQRLGRMKENAVALGKNRAVLYGAGTTAAAGAAGAAYRSHQKKAAFDALIADGIDFDTATSLIQQVSQE